MYDFLGLNYIDKYFRLKTERQMDRKIYRQKSYNVCNNAHFIKPYLALVSNFGKVL